MDHNGQGQRMYQQYSERNASAMHNPTPAPSAARFRHPSTIQSSSSIESSPTFGGSGQGLVDPTHFSGSSLQSGFHYPQFTAAEPMAFSMQSHHQSAQYGQTYYYGSQQPAPSTEHAAQDPLQRYSRGPARNSSIASTSSQYSLPQTPQSQYFNSSHGSQFSVSTRAGEVGAPAASASFESSPYTQSGYSSYQPLGQMLPPSDYGAYSSNHQQHATRNVQDVDKAYEAYQSKAREIFTLVRDGQLRETQGHLLYISQYLLGNAEGLGLDKDDKQLYEERLKLWDTFNHTWLTALQAQLDLTRETVARGGQHSKPAQTMLSVDDMEKLGHELVRLCDGIAVFGLVDYQMGVAEEEILELLIKCLDLLDPAPTPPPEQADTRAFPPATAMTR